MASEDLISRAAGFMAALAAMAAAGLTTIPDHALNESAPAGVISVYVRSSDPAQTSTSERVATLENKPESNPPVLPSESYTKPGSGDTKTLPSSKPYDNSVKTVKAPPEDLQNQAQDKTPKKSDTANTSISSDNSKPVPKTKTAAPVIKKDHTFKNTKNTGQTKTSDRKTRTPVLRKQSAPKKTQIPAKQISKNQSAYPKGQSAPDLKNNNVLSSDHATAPAVAADLSSNSKPALAATVKSQKSPGTEMVKLAVSNLRSELKRGLVYPRAAIRRDLEGTVKVRFEIKGGRVSSASVSSSSGEEILDESALKLALSLKGFQVIENGDLSVVIPVEYRLD